MLELVKSDTYAKWFDGLRDRMARARIDKQVMRIQMAGRLIGDWKHVGDGVIEQRLDFGPGYRVYLSIEGDTILLLLVGGEKHGQQDDISKAKKILRDWRAKNGRGVQ